MAKTTKKDDKVMDVSKPGSSAPDASSRPVIVGHRTLLQDPMMKSAEPEADKEEKVIVSTTAPTIKPPSESKSDKVEVVGDSPESAKIEKSDVKESAKETGEPKQDESKPLAVIESTEMEKDETKPETDDEPKETEEQATTEESKDEPKPDTEPEENSESSNSDEAATDVLAEQAAAKKTTDKEDKEAVARQEAVQKLVTDKTYNLPIGEAKRKRNMSLVVLLLLLIVAAALLYLAIDAEIIKTSIKLPVEFIK
ncbi:MAG TPA: hypothetical protein VLE69_00705 [Candidatus Saccharimonadales bacterium]|nr:hypothetical protein [Candidatus Saccharimonadales bacterium]